VSNKTDDRFDFELTTKSFINSSPNQNKPKVELSNKNKQKQFNSDKYHSQGLWKDTFAFVFSWSLVFISIGFVFCGAFIFGVSWMLVAVDSAILLFSGIVFKLIDRSRKDREEARLTLQREELEQRKRNNTKYALEVCLNEISDLKLKDEQIIKYLDAKIQQENKEQMREIEKK